MNNQQQVDKKRHSSKMMRSKSLNVTATSLISSFFAKSRSELKAKRERERGRVARVDIKRDREERKREKNGKIFFFGNNYRNWILKGIGPVKRDRKIQKSGKSQI